MSGGRKAERGKEDVTREGRDGTFVEVDCQLPDPDFTIANIDRVEVVNEVLELHPEASILV